MDNQEFREFAKQNCGFIKTPTMECGHEKRWNKFCGMNRCPCIGDMIDCMLSFKV